MRIYTILASVLLFYSIKVGAERLLYEARYLGCYEDGKPHRSLTGAYENLWNRATVNVCTNWCFTQGYKLAGLQYGYECYCGDRYKRNRGNNPVGGCTMACKGNASQTCGGGFRNSLYRRVTVTATASTTTTSTTTTSTTSSTPTTTTTTIKRRTNSLITPAYNVTGFNPSSLTNQSDDVNKAQDNSHDIGIYKYVGGGVAVFVIVIVIVMVIVIRKRNNSKPQATKSVNKNLRRNTNNEQNRFGDETGEAMVHYTALTTDRNSPPNVYATINTYDTVGDNAENGEHSTAVYCDTVVTGEAIAHNTATAPTTEHNSPPDVYATVN